MSSCKLDVSIPLPKIANIVKNLKKKIEVSGVLHCDHTDNVVKIDELNGQKDSVYTPNHVINYHTHPYSAYNQGTTVWGWPSGEDIRETIKFALEGNKAHLVLTIEGIYTIQVSPCKIKKMKNLKKKDCEVLIFLIEEYFKTTHNFRCIDEVNSLARKNFFINPYSWVDFINNFNLSNLNVDKKTVHKTPTHSDQFTNQFTRIPNVGFPEVEVTNNSYINTLPMKDVIDKTFLNNFKPVINRLFKEFDATKCTALWNTDPNNWFHVNFFPSRAFLSGSFYNGNKFITPNKNFDFNLVQTPYIRIFSTDAEGCSVLEIGKKNKFKTKKLNFGNNKITPKQRFIIFTIVLQNKNNKTMDFTQLAELTNNKIKSEKLEIPLVNATQLEQEFKNPKK